MILRKPFAMLIKHFKLIHLIMLTFMIYITFSASRILSFVSEYMGGNPYLINHSVSLELFPPLLYWSFFIVIAVALLLLFILAFKEKPIKFYIYAIATYIFALIIMTMAKANIATLEIQLLEIRQLRVLQDLSVLSIVLQAVALIFISFRATGFDIKSFDFKKDLEELDIAEEDSEEFEVDFEIDSDRMRRRIKRFFRNFKYVYVENKYVFAVIILIVVSISSVAIYLNANVYDKVYLQDEPFTTTKFIMNIDESYVTKYDYRGNQISEDYQFVIIKYDVKSKTATNKQIKSVEMVLRSNEHNFYPENSYLEEFSDIGEIYDYDYISNDFLTFINVYKIPNSYELDPKSFVMLDGNNEVNVDLKPVNLNTEKIVLESDLDNEIVLNDSILEETKLNIIEYEIDSKFIVKYLYEYRDLSYNSIEYLKPVLNSNDDKDLIKISGSYKFDTELGIKEFESIDSLLRKYGSINYIVDGTKYSHKLGGDTIKPIKSVDKNTAYFEVNTDVKDASEIELVINIRNKVYKYSLKN